MIKWYNYGGALLLKDRDPHSDNSDITYDVAKKALKEHGGYFCRWTSNFDCGYQTEWWYCIKDTAVSLSDLSSKQRYRINKGLKNFEIRKLDSKGLEKSIHSMYEIALDCFKEYPSKYRPRIEEDEFTKTHLAGINKSDYWIVIDRESEKIEGYSICTINNYMVHLTVVKIRPDVFKKEPNAAIIYELCDYYLNKKGLRYICDGERNIRHETNYQDFLVKTINFRYAYCQLNIVYNPIVKLVITLLFPLRKMLRVTGNNVPLFYNLYCLLKQDEYARSFK